MHRPSAIDDPDAPLGHHWQDSTHVTFGVATAGFAWKNIKVESSIFTGREPDENRYDFDRPRFDSFSGRISWNPIENLAFQVSHGYIKSPEALEPDLKRHRTTASVIYNLPLGQDSNWSNTFVLGQNHDTGEGKTQSFLVESNYHRRRGTAFSIFCWLKVPEFDLLFLFLFLGLVLHVTFHLFVVCACVDRLAGTGGASVQLARRPPLGIRRRPAAFRIFWWLEIREF